MHLLLDWLSTTDRLLGLIESIILRCFSQRSQQCIDQIRYQTQSRQLCGCKLALLPTELQRAVSFWLKNNNTGPAACYSSYITIKFLPLSEFGFNFERNLSFRGTLLLLLLLLLLFRLPFSSFDVVSSVRFFSMDTPNGGSAFSCPGDFTSRLSCCKAQRQNGFIQTHIFTIFRLTLSNDNNENIIHDYLQVIKHENNQ